MQQSDVSLYEKIKENYNEALVILQELKEQKNEDKIKEN